VPGDDDLEHAPVNLPVAKLLGPPLVVAQVDDVQPVAHVIENEAPLAPVVADRPGFPQRVDVSELHLLAPDAPGSRGETVLLGGRRGGEQRDISVGGPHGSLV